MSEHLFDQIEKLISMEARVAWDVDGISFPDESPYVNAETRVDLHLKPTSGQSDAWFVYVEGRLVAGWCVDAGRWLLRRFEPREEDLDEFRRRVHDRDRPNMLTEFMEAESKRWADERTRRERVAADRMERKRLIDPNKVTNG